jgi:hypothetical protein
LLEKMTEVVEHPAAGGDIPDVASIVNPPIENLADDNVEMSMDTDSNMRSFPHTAAVPPAAAASTGSSLAVPDVHKSLASR